MHKSLLFLSVILAACQSTSEPVATPSPYQSQFDTFWRAFDEKYSYFRLVRLLGARPQNRHTFLTIS